jgi:hypothetical protein
VLKSSEPSADSRRNRRRNPRLARLRAQLIAAPASVSMEQLGVDLQLQAGRSAAYRQMLGPDARMKPTPWTMAGGSS